MQIELGVKNNYLLTRDAQFFELQSPSNKKFVKVTNFRFKLGYMGFNSFPYSIQKLWNSNFHCNKNNKKVTTFFKLSLLLIAKIKIKEKETYNRKSIRTSLFQQRKTMHPPKIQSFKTQIHFNLSQKIRQKEISFSSYYLHENQIFFILHMQKMKTL